jgi:uncharacterized protein (TIGR03435 family)
MWVVEFAYNAQSKQVAGAPSWLNSFANGYDIEGKSDGPISESDCRLMVQSLLADRFKLAVHWEKQEKPSYALVMIAKGSKLHEVKKGDAGGGVKINGAVQQSVSEHEAPGGWTLEKLATYLSSFAGRPVVDKTGLTGTYSFSLDFARAPADEGIRPSIFTAVQEQLGLKLEATRTVVEVLNIDQVERPSEN